nr:prisilkin-39-like [Penaeus vannamei]
MRYTSVRKSMLKFQMKWIFDLRICGYANPQPQSQPHKRRSDLRPRLRRPRTGRNRCRRPGIGGIGVGGIGVGGYGYGYGYPGLAVGHSVWKRDADPEPGYHHGHVATSYVGPRLHGGYSYGYPLYGYGGYGGFGGFGGFGGLGGFGYGGYGYGK